MTTWQIVAVLLTISATNSAIVLLAMKLTLGYVMQSASREIAAHAASDDRRIKAVEEHVSDTRRSVADLREELPLEYVRREDLTSFRSEVLRSQAIVDYKLDQLRNMIASLQLHSQRSRQDEGGTPA